MTESEKKRHLKKQGVLNPGSKKVKDPIFQGNSFFDPNDLVQVKYEMVRQVSHEGKSVSEAARNYGMSRPTFYQAQTAIEREGILGLAPQKSGPRSRHKINSEVMDFINDKMAENTSLNSKDLTEAIREKFSISIHPRSVDRALANQKKSRSDN